MSLDSFFRITVFVPFTILMSAGCASSLPQERHDVYSFPESRAYLQEPSGENLNRPFEILGWVKIRERFPTMEQDPNNGLLCKNYYNKGVASLLKEVKKINGDAVIRIRSVVILMNGQVEEYLAPECSDDGAEGEILLRGVAIRWKPPEEKTVNSNP